MQACILHDRGGDVCQKIVSARSKKEMKGRDNHGQYTNGDG
jgi:hypothetical protein